jgi:glycogen debranching enzyme
MYRIRSRFFAHPSIFPASTKIRGTLLNPLLAGIPDEARAQRMLKHLLDPKEFWGDLVVPSVARSDPSFRPERQQYWRGAIWPSTNYLIYQGLKAYGFDAVASEFARKSAEMFLRSWTSFGPLAGVL